MSESYFFRSRRPPIEVCVDHEDNRVTRRKRQTIALEQFEVYSNVAVGFTRRQLFYDESGDALCVASVEKCFSLMSINKPRRLARSV